MNPRNQRSSTRNLCIVQARMSSSRLPGKVLAPLYDSTVIDLLLTRLAKSSLLDEIIVATSKHITDDTLVDHLLNTKVHRGDLFDVRSRYVELCAQYQPKNIVRITADCPLICWELVDKVIEFHEQNSAQYTANCNFNAFPKGFNVEVFKTEVLMLEDFQTDNDYEKEHVTPWMYTSGKLKVANYEFSTSPTQTNLNFSVDTQEDLTFLQNLEVELPIESLTFEEIWMHVANK
jgi:spore coat polysaccharide biosynthesis protein SpsF (cytidylyltransferase family)